MQQIARGFHTLVVHYLADHFGTQAMHIHFRDRIQVIRIMGKHGAEHTIHHRLVKMRRIHAANHIQAPEGEEQADRFTHGQRTIGNNQAGHHLIEVVGEYHQGELVFYRHRL